MPYFVDESQGRVEVEAGDVMAPVGLAPLDASGSSRLRRRGPEVDVEAVDVVGSLVRRRSGCAGARPARRAGTRRRSTGPRRGKAPDALGVGWQRGRHGAEERQRRPSREVGRRAREPDDERVPARDDARCGLSSCPASTSAAPTMSRVSMDARRVASPGASVRLIARAKALARTGVPSLKRKPLRSVNVNVLRSRETFGTAAPPPRVPSRKPAGGGLSGYVRRRAQTVSSSAHAAGV